MHILNMDDSEVLETTDTETEQEENTEEVEKEEEEQEDEEKVALRKEKEELEKKNKQLYERLKKTDKAPATQSSLSAKDFLALKDANITAEDFDEVQDYAKFRKISIAEALANPTLKSILRDKAEERRTEQAKETRSPRGIAKTTGEDLLQKAEKTNEIPTTEEGMESIIRARLERKRSK